MALALVLGTVPAAASAATVKVQTVVVTARVISEKPARSERPVVRRVVGRHRQLPSARHHVPRPLSPGEFGRPRRGI